MDCELNALKHTLDASGPLPCYFALVLYKVSGCLHWSQQMSSGTIKTHHEDLNNKNIWKKYVKIWLCLSQAGSNVLSITISVSTADGLLVSTVTNTHGLKWVKASRLLKPWYYGMLSMCDIELIFIETSKCKQYNWYIHLISAYFENNCGHCSVCFLMIEFAKRTAIPTDFDGQFTNKAHFSTW